MIRETHYATVECDAPGCPQFQEFKAPDGPLSALWLPACFDFLRGHGWTFSGERIYCPEHREAGFKPAPRRGKGDARGESKELAVPDGPGADSDLCLFEL